MSVFIVIDTEGNERSGAWRSLDAAVGDAKEMLEIDPELYQLEVYEIPADQSQNPGGTLRKTICFGPDAHWDTIIVTLDPGERLQPPGPIPHRVTEDDLDGYDVGDPKRAALEQVIERGGWA